MIVKVIHQPSIITAIDRAKANARKKKKSFKHEDILSQLQFSTWRYMLPESSEASAKIRLWNDALRKAFVHLDETGKSKFIAAIVRIYYMRNRIAHLEPTLKSPKIRNIYNDLVFVTGIISKDLQNWIISRQKITYYLKRKP